MKYKISWGNKLARVDYFGAIENKDIKEAHFKLNSDERFYSCDYLILNVITCDLSQVSVPDLLLVIGTDLGATYTNNSLKVAMLASNPTNVDKVNSYISKNRSIGTPWEFRLFSSLENAKEWFDN